MYYITYKNQGKSEKTPPFATYEEAKKSADFLKFQGATSVRIQKKEIEGDSHERKRKTGEIKGAGRFLSGC